MDEKDNLKLNDKKEILQDSILKTPTNQFKNLKKTGSKFPIFYYLY